MRGKFIRSGLDGYCRVSKCEAERKFTDNREPTLRCEAGHEWRGNSLTPEDLNKEGQRCDKIVKKIENAMDILNRDINDAGSIKTEVLQQFTEEELPPKWLEKFGKVLDKKMITAMLEELLTAYQRRIEYINIRGDGRYWRYDRRRLASANPS